MKNLTKSLLATLMLIGFSTNVFAVVDCEGLERKNRLNGQLTRANLGSEYHQCRVFNDKGYTWDFVSKEGQVRYQNQQWNGIIEYKEGDNYYSRLNGDSVQKVVKKTMSMAEIRAYKFD